MTCPVEDAGAVHTFEAKAHGSNGGSGSPFAFVSAQALISSARGKDGPRYDTLHSPLASVGPQRAPPSGWSTQTVTPCTGWPIASRTVAVTVCVVPTGLIEVAGVSVMVVPGGPP